MLESLAKYAPDQPRDYHGRFSTSDAARATAMIHADRAVAYTHIASRPSATSYSAKLAAESHFKAARAHDSAFERIKFDGNPEDAEKYRTKAQYHRQQQEAFNLSVNARKATERAYSTERRGGKGADSQAAQDHAVASRLHSEAASRHAELGNNELASSHNAIASEHRQAKRSSKRRAVTGAVSGAIAALGISATIRSGTKDYVQDKVKSAMDETRTRVDSFFARQREQRAERTKAKEKAQAERWSKRFHQTKLPTASSNLYTASSTGETTGVVVRPAPRRFQRAIEAAGSAASAAASVAGAIVQVPKPGRPLPKRRRIAGV